MDLFGLCVLYYGFVWFVCSVLWICLFVCSVLWICLCVLYYGFVWVFYTMDMFVCSALWICLFVCCVLWICLCVKRELSESSTTGLIDTNGPKMDAAFVCFLLAFSSYLLKISV